MRPRGYAQIKCLLVSQKTESQVFGARNQYSRVNSNQKNKKVTRKSRKYLNIQTNIPLLVIKHSSACFLKNIAAYLKATF